jgi:hypothetical protein
MRFSFFIAGILTLSTLALADEPMMRPPPPPPPGPPVIVVTGNGEVDVRPDQAMLSMGAIAQEKDAAAAQKKVSEIVQKSLDAFAAMGIKKEKIHTQNVTLTPVYRRGSPDDLQRPRDIVGYEASNVLQITLGDLTQIGQAMDAGVGAGANNIQGVDFQLSDDTGATQDALKRATLQAQAKARAIADALGVHLGTAMKVEEGSVQRIMPMMAMSRMAAANVATPIEPGEIKINAQVTVTYRIEANGR